MCDANNVEDDNVRQVLDKNGNPIFKRDEGEERLCKKKKLNATCANIISMEQKAEETRYPLMRTEKKQFREQ